MSHSGVKSSHEFGGDPEFGFLLAQEWGEDSLPVANHCQMAI